MNAIVWQCRRGTAACERLTAGGHDRTVRRKTGLKLDTYFSGPKLMWLAETRPDIHRKLATGGAVVGTIDAYLIHRLTGGKVFATDPTNASRTLLYDISRLQWDDELCALFDVQMGALPEVRESASRFGQTDAAGALPATLPISGVMGDSQASLFAQCCYEPGMGKATFGSGTSVLVNAGDHFELSGNDSIVALAWVLDNRPTYAVEGLINYSSATIAWLKDQLGLIADARDSESLAQAVEDNGGVYLVPAFSGLSAPYWRPEARAAIVGMTAGTRKEHIVRAALESISYQIRDVLEMMQSHASVVPQVLYADGGPTRNKFLMQFTADITGVELRVSEVAESSARGAAMAAMLGLSAARSLAELAALPREVRLYRREMEAGKVESLYSGWKQAVKRVL
jgi:glycerol kinase